MRNNRNMGGTIVLGIGNRLGGDDAAGVYTVDILSHRLRDKTRASCAASIIAIDGGTAPESYTSVIRQRQPDLLIVVDAADMGLPPGALRIIPQERIGMLFLSTHHMPLSMFISYIEEFCGKVVLVGVQPEQTETGGRVSGAVRQSVKKLAEAILEGRVAEIPLLE